MDNRRALMATIVAHPDDDAPRLVFADWLQEHGDDHDQARAEFIRLQIAMARMPEGDRQRTKFNQRAEKILKQHREAWIAPLVPLEERRFNRTGNDITDWSRGLLGRLFMPTQTFLLKATQQILPDALASLGVETIEFTSTTKRITAITDSPALEWVSAVIWRACDDQGLKAFAQSPTCSHLSSIEFEDCKATDAGLRAFATSPVPSRLRRFALPLARVVQPRRKYTAAGVVAVLESPRLPLLDTLDLGGIQQTRFAYETLFASPALKRLVRLRVGGEVPVSSLVACPHLTALHELAIEDAQIDDQHIETLLANRAFDRLQKFTLWDVNHNAPKLARASMKKLHDRVGKNLQIDYSINSL